jgi:hypothetical protein
MIHVEDEVGLRFCAGAWIGVCAVVIDAKFGELGKKLD